jgi:hypothetical protein
LQQTPVGVGEPQEELAEFEVVAGHGADLRDQFLANVLGHGFLIHLGGEVVAALGRVFVEGPLEELQTEVDLPVELLLADLEDLKFFAHTSAYIYAYIMEEKPSSVKGAEQKNRRKL